MSEPRHRDVSLVSESALYYSAAMADEFARIAEIRRRLSAGARASSHVVLGIGDDAALLAASERAQAISVDAQVEHVHFERDLLSGTDLGYRALASALSDLAAMGAVPRAALVAMIVPPELSETELYAIADGFAEAQHAFGCQVAGGNLARGRELSITTTVIGDAARRPLTRGGARPGDALFVTGELGASALGLHALRGGRTELAPACVTRWRRLHARIREGVAIAELAGSAIDVSDGLLQDLSHLARASGVGFEIELAQLPFHVEMARACGELALDPQRLALSGGEDYELLFTVPKGVVPPHGTCIGEATAASGLRGRGRGGERIDLPPAGGYDHFVTT
jgi:thiamine-monophosphate kinase